MLALCCQLTCWLIPSCCNHRFRATLFPNKYFRRGLDNFFWLLCNNQILCIAVLLLFHWVLKQGSHQEQSVFFSHILSLFPLVLNSWSCCSLSLFFNIILRDSPYFLVLHHSRCCFISNVILGTSFVPKFILMTVVQLHLFRVELWWHMVLKYFAGWHKIRIIKIQWHW